MPTVLVSKNYLRCRKRLSRERQALADDAIIRFETDPTELKLNFEPIVSRDGYHSIRVDFGTRTLLHHEGADEYEARAVGNHDFIYKAYFRS